jgi:hypothetical protein
MRFGVGLCVCSFDMFLKFTTICNFFFFLKIGVFVWLVFIEMIRETASQLRDVFHQLKSPVVRLQQLLFPLPQDPIAKRVNTLILVAIIVLNYANLRNRVKVRV